MCDRVESTGPVRDSLITVMSKALEAVTGGTFPSSGVTTASHVYLPLSDCCRDWILTLPVTTNPGSKVIFTLSGSPVNVLPFTIQLTTTLTPLLLTPSSVTKHPMEMSLPKYGTPFSIPIAIVGD